MSEMIEKTFIVNEIFDSIDGEGIRAGSRAIFIRLAGCNLRCSYCDTAYALSHFQGVSKTISEIIAEIKPYNCKHITLTGGEPLSQPYIDEFIDALIDKGYIVNIETNGSIDIRPYLKENVIITMDYKMPSSGMENYMFLKNLQALRNEDVLKFVCGENDLECVTRVIKKYKPQSWIYLSPVFGKIEPLKLVNYIKNFDGDTEKMRVQVQLHKIIWAPDKRGV